MLLRDPATKRDKKKREKERQKQQHQEEIRLEKKRRLEHVLFALGLLQGFQDLPAWARKHGHRVDEEGLLVHGGASKERWRDAVATTHGLYQEARLARLGTDKFLIDGRHIGNAMYYNIDTVRREAEIGIGFRIAESNVER